MAGLNLRGDTSGSVEIVSPAVAGDNTITLPNDNGSANQFFKNSTTAGIVTHSSMIEDASGNIGIGTDNPSTKLHVEGSVNNLFHINSTDEFASISMADTNGSVRMQTSSGQLRFFTGGDAGTLAVGAPERIRITADGLVGIATDNPSSDLHVFGSTDASAIIDAAAGDGLLTLRNAGNGNYSGIDFTRERSTGTNVTGGSIWMPSITANNEATLFIQTQTASAGAGVSDTLGANNGVRLKLSSHPNGVSGDSSFNVEVGDAQALRIDVNQRVYMGEYFEIISNLRDAQTTTDRSAKVQIVGNNGPGAGLALVSYNDGGSGYYSPHIWLAKSDTSTLGNNNRVEDGDDLGSICFAGSDGQRFLNAAAIITEVDGGAGVNDMPGRLEFHVSANGASTLTERFRIQNNGNLLATDTTIGSLSDSRLKTNISDFTYDLELFKQFQPRTFDWINPELHDNAVGQRGFIAQEIESVDTTYVFESKIKESSDDSQLVGDDNVAKSAKLGKNDAMYISVIQQLISKIETLETKVAALEGN